MKHRILQLLLLLLVSPQWANAQKSVSYTPIEHTAVEYKGTANYFLKVYGSFLRDYKCRVPSHIREDDNLASVIRRFNKLMKTKRFNNLLVVRSLFIYSPSRITLYEFRFKEEEDAKQIEAFLAKKDGSLQTGTVVPYYFIHTRKYSTIFFVSSASSNEKIFPELLYRMKQNCKKLG